MSTKDSTSTHGIISKLLFFVGIALILFSCYHRTAYIDDAWLGEYAYWFSKLGYVKTNLFSGVEVLQEKVLIYPRLHIWIGSAITWLFGFKLYAIKATSLVWLIGLITLLYKIYFRSDQLLFWGISGLILMHYLFLQFSFIYRPEIGLAMLGLLAYYLAVIRYQSFTDNQVAIALGVIGGLAFLLHRNGIIYIASVGILYLITLKPKPILLFSLFSLAVGSLYFYDFTSAGDFTLYQNQMAANFQSTLNESIRFNPLLNLINEHERYFRNVGQISFSLLFIYSLIMGRTIKNPTYRRTVVFTILLMIFMAMANPPKTSKYMIPLIPFWSIVIVHAYYLIIRHQTIKRLLFGLLVIFYCGSHLTLSIDYIKSHQKSTIQLNESIAGELEPDSRILAPITYVFDHIEDYESIQCHRAHRYYFDHKPSAREILEYASSKSLDYVILSPKEFIKDTRPDDLQIKGMKFVQTVDERWVYKRLAE